MSYESRNLFRCARYAQLAELLEYLAEMVSEPENGEVFVPIFTRIEDEIAKLSVTDSAVERAIRIKREKESRDARG